MKNSRTHKIHINVIFNPLFDTSQTNMQKSRERIERQIHSIKFIVAVADGRAGTMTIGPDQLGNIGFNASFQTDPPSFCLLYHYSLPKAQRSPLPPPGE